MLLFLASFSTQWWSCLAMERLPRQYLLLPCHFWRVCCTLRNFSDGCQKSNPCQVREDLLPSVRSLHCLEVFSCCHLCRAQPFETVFILFAQLLALSLLCSLCHLLFLLIGHHHACLSGSKCCLIPFCALLHLLTGVGFLRCLYW